MSLLRAAGINVVFSSGNQGPNPGTSVSPANNPSSYAVGSVDSSLNVSAISGRGPSACTGGIYPNIVAPGIDIKTSDLTFGGIFPNSYAFVSGTSAAAPHVAGAMALLRQAYPDATVMEIETALAQSAYDIDVVGVDNNSGSGLINVLAAYNILNGGVVPTNNLPVANNDSYQINSGEVLNVAVPGLLANDTDADGDILAVNENPVVSVTGGELTLFADGSFVYVPNAGTVSDSFSYEVSDGVDTDQAQVFITVNQPVNHHPTAVNDEYSVNGGTTLVVASPGLLLNDSDDDGDNLSISTTPVAGPANGHLTLYENGGFEYTPDPGVQSDSFVYQVSDGVDTAQGTVTINVIPVPAGKSAPVAVVDDVSVPRNSTDVFINLTSNDYDVDGNLHDASGNVFASQIELISGSTTSRRGSLVKVDNGVLYTPRRNYRGTDTFTYAVTDSDGMQSNSVTVSITVTR